MGFELEEQYEIIGDVVAQFVKEEIVPRVREIDKKVESHYGLDKRCLNVVVSIRT